MAIIPKRALVGTVNAGGIPVHETFDPATNIFVGPDGSSVASAAQAASIANIFADTAARTSQTYIADDVGKIFLQSSDNSLWLLTNHSPQTWSLLGSNQQVYNYVFADAGARTSHTYTTGDTGKLARQLDDNSVWMLVTAEPATWQNLSDNGNATSIQGKVPGALSGLAELDENGLLKTEQIPGHLVTTGQLGGAAYLTVGENEGQVAAGNHQHMQYATATHNHSNYALAADLGNIALNPITTVTPAVFATNTDIVEVAHEAPGTAVTQTKFKTVVNLKAGENVNHVRLAPASATQFSPAWQSYTYLTFIPEEPNALEMTWARALNFFNQNASLNTNSPTIITDTFTTQGSILNISGSTAPECTTIRVKVVNVGFEEIEISLYDQNDNVIVENDPASVMSYMNQADYYYYDNGYNITISMMNISSLAVGNTYEATYPINEPITVDRYFLEVNVDGTNYYIGNDGSISDGTNKALAIFPGTMLGTMPSQLPKDLVNLLGTVGYDEAFYNNSKTVYGVFNEIKAQLLLRPTTNEVANTEFDASKVTSGVLDIARIPAAALERLVPVADLSTRFSLTPDDVQLGDIVKQLDTGVMYVVIDEANLGNESGYSIYTAGYAAAVPWSGILDKPLDFLPSEHDLSSHVVDGLTTGHFLKATGVDTFSFMPHGLTATDVGAAPASHVGSIGSVHGTVTTTVPGFMSPADKLKLDGVANKATANTGTVTNVSGTGSISVANGTTSPIVSIALATTSSDGAMSAADKTKLDGVASGATANAGTVTNVSGTGSISVTDGTTTPTIAIALATTSSDGAMSAADKTKLDGVASGATANAGTVTNVSGTGSISVTDGTTTPTIAIALATTSSDGAMSLADKAKLDEITASASTPSAPSEAGTVGTSTSYARGDHSHPSRIATVAPDVPQNGDIWIA